MTAQTKAANKLKFQTGDKPTQADFEDLIDSYQDANSVLSTLTSAAGLSAALVLGSSIQAGGVGFVEIISADQVRFQAAGSAGRVLFSAANIAGILSTIAQAQSGISFSGRTIFIAASGVTNSELDSDSVDYRVVQSGFVVGMTRATVSGHVSGAVVIPFDTTRPQISEGNALFSVNHVMKSSSNLVKLTLNAQIGNSTGSAAVVTIAIFRNNDVNAIVAKAKTLPNNEHDEISIDFVDTPGTASPVYKARFGNFVSPGTGIGIGGATNSVLGGAEAATFTMLEFNV